MLTRIIALWNRASLGFHAGVLVGVLLATVAFGTAMLTWALWIIHVTYIGGTP
jgi:hypothetical protein